MKKPQKPPARPKGASSAEDARPSSPPAEDAENKPAENAPRTEGQRLLREAGAKVSDIARTVGCAKGIASDWLLGRKVPGAAYRDKLSDAYGIPPRAWNELPAGAERVPAAPPVPRAMSVLPESADLYEEAKREAAAILQELGNGNLLPAERAKFRANRIAALNLQRQLKLDRQKAEDAAARRQAEREDRLTRTEPWLKAVMDTVAKVVAPHPEVARAIDAALSDLEARR